MSNTTRWGGHCCPTINVAQHSVIVARLLRSAGCPSEVQMQGLLHDAAEAYLEDLKRPIKRLPEMAWYCEREDAVQRVVCDAFGLPHEEPAIVKHVDAVMLMTEKRDLMAPEPAEWGDGQGVRVKPRKDPIAKYDMEQVESMFLARFKELTSER